MEVNARFTSRGTVLRVRRYGEEQRLFLFINDGIAINRSEIWTVLKHTQVKKLRKVLDKFLEGEG